MPEDRLDSFIVHAKPVKVCGKATAEGVPPVPARQGVIASKFMAFGLVFLFEFPANRTAGERGNNHSAREIVEIQGLPIACLKDWPDRRPALPG
jgi:hypothetical protein